MAKNAKEKLIEKIQASSSVVVAKEAKVSPTTLTSLLKDGTSTDEADQSFTKNKLKDWNKKKSLGLISSLIKLARWADLVPEDLIACYPIPFNKQIINGWIKDTEQRIFPKHDLLADKKIANLPFEPFNLRRSDGLQWGERFSLRLLKGIDPTWDSVVTPTKFDEKMLIQQLSVSNSHNRLDLLFGLFRSSKRVAHQVNFIDIPGIRIKLGMLSNVPLTWRDIEKASYNGMKIKFITIKGYVSESYLSASCFNNDVISTVPSLKEIPTHQDSWHELAISLKDKIDQINSTESYDIYCFVCSANIIEKIEKHLKNMQFDEETDITNYRLPKTLNKVLTKEQKDNLFAEYTPSYQACFALNPHSNNLSIESARYALFNTMFLNGIFLTAEEYIDLLLGDLESNGFFSIHFINIESQMPKDLWKKFLEVCITCIEERLQKVHNQKSDSKKYRNSTQTHLEIIKQLFKYELLSTSSHIFT